MRSKKDSCCPVNYEYLWKKTQIENRVASAMIVLNIFRPLYITLTFPHNNHCYHDYCYHDYLILDIIILELDLASRKKTHNFSNSVK